MKPFRADARWPRLWPLHPPPGVLESLSSWLGRLAGLYGMSVKDLLGPHNLDLRGVEVPHDIDVDPPQALLSALAERTGADLTQLRAMTLAGWATWLFDDLHLRRLDEQETFHTYVRANSVLLTPGEAGSNQVGYPRGWGGPWLAARRSRRCPVCAADPERGTALMWTLPLTLSCADHGCYLENASQAELAVRVGEPMQPRPVPEPLATLERHTYTALTTGRVELVGRPVHAGVWFRLLRSLLDEVSLAPSGRRTHGRSTLERVWATAGLPERGGLNVWRPYEHLEPDVQEMMMLAAATALHLAAEGEITARGRLSSAVQPPPRRYVYDGDRPDPLRNAWAEAVTEVETMMIAARTDPAVARQLLIWFTMGCRTHAWFQDQRAYLFGAGIPAAFLPSAAELGRTGLT